MWQPELSSAEGQPLYRRLADAIAAAIASGELKAGDRLPPQRDLAYRLSISVGAVTHAYEEATRRGLVAAHVGRGTFVSAGGADETVTQGIIDLGLNIAPLQPIAATAETLGSLRRASIWAERLCYQPPQGLEADRRAGATWLGASAGFDGLDWRRLLCCSGAQNAMAIAFAALCRPGDTLLSEAATFPGAKTLAAQQACRLHGVAMDGEGLLPQALDREASRTGARVLYALPTLQNPTARTMSLRRREDIVAIARKRDLWIVEDDVYGLYARDLGLPPLALLAPERTLYVSSLSKTLTPGLRAGFLVAPAGDIFERCLRAMRALNHSPNGVTTAIATDWIESGRAEEMAREVFEEMQVRTASAVAALGERVEAPHPANSLHLWLPMSPMKAERTVMRAYSRGLRLASPQTFDVSGGGDGLRLCLGSVPNRPTLNHVLAVLQAVLDEKPDDLTADVL